MRIDKYDIERTEDGLIKIDDREPMTRGEAELFLMIRVGRVEDIERLYRL